MDKIAVLIPCYNESKTVAKVVSDFRGALPEATVYVYDNNSGDGTDELARTAGAVVREEIAYINGWIDRAALLASVARYGNSPYGAHLSSVAEGKVMWRIGSGMTGATASTLRRSSVISAGFPRRRSRSAS